MRRPTMWRSSEAEWSTKDGARSGEEYLLERTLFRRNLHVTWLVIIRIRSGMLGKPSLSRRLILVVGANKVSKTGVGTMQRPASTIESIIWTSYTPRSVSSLASTASSAASRTSAPNPKPGAAGALPVLVIADGRSKPCLDLRSHDCALRFGIEYPTFGLGRAKTNDPTCDVLPEPQPQGPRRAESLRHCLAQQSLPAGPPRRCGHGALRPHRGAAVRVDAGRRRIA